MKYVAEPSLVSHGGALRQHQWDEDSHVRSTHRTHQSRKSGQRGGAILGRASGRGTERQRPIADFDNAGGSRPPGGDELMTNHAAKARKGLFSALAKDRVTKSISNPTVKAHAHGVAALLMFVAGRLEHRYGAPFAINFHSGLFHAGTSSSARLGALITTMVGVGAVRNAASHWLGVMDYHELAVAALPLYEEARHTTILARVPDIDDVDDELALLMHEIGIRFTDGAITIIEPY